MENTPKNVCYLRLSGVILSIISIALFTLAYHYLPEMDKMQLAVSSPSICIMALGLFALINAFYTFKFSTNINEDYFARWQVVQNRFWTAIPIFLILLGCASICAAFATFAPAG